MNDTKQLHDKVKSMLYSLTGITLTENKDIMITNRLDKLKRNTKVDCSIEKLLERIGDGEFATEFINTFTTNKTHFFSWFFDNIGMEAKTLVYISNKTYVRQIITKLFEPL